jgi:hypothetical protein
METSQVVAFGPGDSSSFGFFPIAIAAVLLVMAWVILAGTRFVQGGVVERPDRVPQLYGYTMCLVGLLWALASVVGVVESAQALAAPVYHQQNMFGMEPSISSFEAFRMTYDRARRFSAPDPAVAKIDTLPEAELRRRFETYRADKITATLVQQRQELITKLVSLLLAAAVFVFHWRWLRRRFGAIAT